MAEETTILECFTGLIGIRGCGISEPGSGLYINSLPGISLEMMDGISDTDVKTYAEMWKEVQQRGILSFRTRLMAKLNECYQINERSTVECIACENKELLATALWYYLGIEVMTERQFSNRINWYTTIQSDEAAELKAEYQIRFEQELSFAVQGIDVQHSDCVKNETDCPQPNGAIMWRESIM